MPDISHAHFTNNSHKQSLGDVQNSYIGANVPDNVKFDSFMTRDLEKYFGKTEVRVKVTWELLRQGATQSGVAYPKYYVWVKIFKDSKLVGQGAARVETIKKINFNVTDYVKTLDIKNEKVDIYSIFPRLVCENIKTKI